MHVPSSFAIGWSPPSRSMIASRRAASPTPPSTKVPSRVGPAVDERRRHRGEPVAVDPAAGRGDPADPAHAGRVYGRRAPRSVWRSTRQPGRRRASAGRAAPSGRRSTRGRARASPPSRSRSPGAPARSRSARAARRAAASRRAARARARRRSAAGSAAARRSDMSPRSTFQSCGISSSCDAFSQRPIRVYSASVRRTSSSPRYGPSRVSASRLSVRNLSIVKKCAAAPDALAAVEDRPPAGQRGSRARSRAPTGSSEQPEDAREDDVEQRAARCRSAAAAPRPRAGGSRRRGCPRAGLPPSRW